MSRIVLLSLLILIQAGISVASPSSGKRDILCLTSGSDGGGYLFIANQRKERSDPMDAQDLGENEKSVVTIDPAGFWRVFPAMVTAKQLSISFFKNPSTGRASIFPRKLSEVDHLNTIKLIYSDPYPGLKDKNGRILISRDSSGGLFMVGTDSQMDKVETCYSIAPGMDPAVLNEVSKSKTLPWECALSEVSKSKTMQDYLACLAPSGNLTEIYCNLKFTNLSGFDFGLSRKLSKDELKSCANILKSSNQRLAVPLECDRK